MNKEPTPVIPESTLKAMEQFFFEAGVFQKILEAKRNESEVKPIE